MIHLRAPKRYVAWLALAAMWLVVFAPVVSQVRFAAAAGIESGWCGAHPPAAPSTSHPHAPAGELCGYCDLFGHSPVLLGVARLAAPRPVTAFPVPVPSDAPRAPSRSLRLFPPRGPPLLVSALIC